jgi:maltose/moltooligosaccharide transporter
MTKKPKLSFWQILNMNVGFFGIQYSFGLQQSAVTPIYDFLGASADQIPILHLAGPVTGLLVQPIIGAISDKTWSTRFGRRKPFFLIGAILCSLTLLVFPYSSSLWMAAGLLWILDVGNNTAMEPYRALIADKLDDDQQPLGFQMQSFFTGLGQVLVNLSIYTFTIIFIGQFGLFGEGDLPSWVYYSFFLGAFCSIASVLWSMSKTKEIPPTDEELIKLKSEKRSVLGPLLEIFSAIKDMPKVMWQLALVYLFQWYALFCYWQNSSKSIALSVWNVTPENKEAYSEAVGWAALVNGWYNAVTFLVAFALVGFAKKHSPKRVHAFCLLIAAVGFLAFPHIESKNLLFFAITGFGIGWASIMGIPYLMIVSEIPKERYGVYMGIINMMIVIPMILQTLSFGYILKNFLNNDPRNAITFAGILLVISAVLTLFIKSKKVI